MMNFITFNFIPTERVHYELIRMYTLSPVNKGESITTLSNTFGSMPYGKLGLFYSTDSKIVDSLVYQPDDKKIVDTLIYQPDIKVYSDISSPTGVDIQEEDNLLDELNSITEVQAPQQKAFNVVCKVIEKQLSTLDPVRLRNDPKYAYEAQRDIEQAVHGILLAEISGNSYKSLLTSHKALIACDEVIHKIHQFVQQEHPMGPLSDEQINALPIAEQASAKSKVGYQGKTFDAKYASPKLAIHVISHVCTTYARSHLAAALLVLVCRCFPNRNIIWRTRNQLTQLIGKEFFDEMVRLFFACCLLTIDYYFDVHLKAPKVEKGEVDKTSKIENRVGVDKADGINQIADKIVDGVDPIDDGVKTSENGKQSASNNQTDTSHQKSPKEAFMARYISTLPADSPHITFIKLMNSGDFKAEALDFSDVFMFRSFASKEGSPFKKEDFIALPELEKLVSILEGLCQCHISKDFLYFLLNMYETIYKKPFYVKNTAMAKIGAGFIQTPATPLPKENSGLNFMLSHIFMNPEIRRFVLQFINYRDLIRYALEIIGENFCIKETSSTAPKANVIKYKLKLEAPVEVFFQHLPMVCTPAPFHWDDTSHRLLGGYIATGHLQHMIYCAVSTKDAMFFNITPNRALLKTINRLQSVKFQINRDFVNFIEEHKELLYNRDLLARPLPDDMTPDEYFASVTKDYTPEELKSYKTYQLREQIAERYSRALREQYILGIAKLYKDVDIYFPCFLDFRGRVYRPGLLNIQGCLLGKALLQIPKNNSSPNIFPVEGKLYNANYDILYQLATSIKKIRNTQEAWDYALKTLLYNEFPAVSIKHESPFVYYSYIYENYKPMFSLVEKTQRDNPKAALIKLPLNGKPEVSFCTKNKMTHNEVLSRYEVVCQDNINYIPLRKDATCSVYQIFAFLTKDIKLGELTNVLRTENQDKGVINDLYTEITDSFYAYLDELAADKSYMTIKYKKNKESVIPETHFETLIKMRHIIYSRSVVKAVIMPMAYGMTLIGAIHVLERKFKEERLLHIHKDLPKGAGFLLYKYLERVFTKPQILTNLLSAFARLMSHLNLPIRWDVGWGTITQQYMKEREEHITLYSSNARLKHMPGVAVKKQRVTLKVQVDGIDARKNAAAISANFIHSLDATIAYNVIETWFNACERNPQANNDYNRFFATVHDCFVYAPNNNLGLNIHTVYSEACVEVLSNPIWLINRLIVKSLKIQLVKTPKEGLTPKCLQKPINEAFLSKTIHELSASPRMAEAHLAHIKKRLATKDQKVVDKIEKQPINDLKKVLESQKDFLVAYKAYVEHLETNKKDFDLALKKRPGAFLS